MDAQHYLTIADVCKRIPAARGARRLAPSTVTRWILQGSRARDGRRIRLLAIRAGSRWLIRPGDLDAFFASLAADPDVPPPPVPPTERERRAAAAGERLRAAGY